MSSRGFFKAATLYACALALPVVGCAEERDPINRVQANALEKSFFVGDLEDSTDNPEFYMRNTVVDVSMGAGADGLFTNSDAMPTSRIRWEINEDFLVARLTYELVDDTDFKGAGNTADGQVVAAYAIQKHFDIKRDYNSSTGEEYNVVVENDADRAWYERKYFRVDWSTNHVTSAYDFDTLSQIGIYYGVRYEPVSYYVSDPNDPDAPVFDVDGGYFDVTNKVYATPELIEDEYGDFPACWLTGYFPNVSCNPSEITLRQAYRKVGDRDYEPLHYDGARMDMFGYFTVDRQGYDRGYGIVDDKWRRFATRWNLYEQTHADPPVPCATPETTPVGADPHRDDDGNGTEDECEAIGDGSRCNEFSGRCTLPYFARPVRTIAWHVNQEFPAELWEGTQEALKAWSDALRVAVVAARVVECRRTGYEGCEGEFGWPSPWSDDYVPPLGNETPDQVPEIFVLCHNPVDPEQGDLEEHCGPAGTSPRPGDIRYNFINVVQDPELAAPWGIMMDVEDPLTGEKIAGSVTEWGSVLDQAATTLADLVGLLNGDIDPESYIVGQDVSDFVAANQRGASGERPPPMSAAELQRRQAAFDPSVVAPYTAGLGSGPAGGHPKLRRQKRYRELVDHGRLGPGNAALTARLESLRGTAIEAAMVSPAMAQAAGYDPTGPISKGAIHRASPVGRMNPSVRRAEDRARRLGRARRHSCKLQAPAPDNLLGLAKVARDRFGSPDPNDPAAVAEHRKSVVDWARRELSRGVMSHEIGHSMGLRHNFAASFDSLNYEPQYWQLRTENGSATADCPAGSNGRGCVAPRYRDPLTPQEIDGNIGAYATTSVMDYPGDQSQDSILPRKYDRAAVRFGYAEVVDVWADVSVDASGAEQAEAYRLTAFTQSPDLFGVNYFPPVDPFDPFEFIHYSQYASQFRLISDCQADDSPGAVLGQRCRERPLDVADYRDMRDFVADPDYDQFSWARQSRAVDPSGRVRRGYMFSGDEYADSGNVPSFSGDAGADPYEQIRFLEGQYENRYVLDAFRRNRVQFNSWDTSARIQYRYLDKIQMIGKAFAFGALLEGDPANPDPSLLDDGFYGPLEVSATVSLDFFARILTRPEPGYYCPADACGYVQPPGVVEDVYVADTAPLPDLFDYDFRVALGDGRYLHNDFDYSQGYWWGDYQTQVGSYYEKIWATYYLAEAFDTFISNSKEDFTDSRYKNVSFATVFPEQVRRLYTNLLTGDLESFAPWVVPDRGSSGTPLHAIEYPAWFDPADIGTRPANSVLIDPNYAFNEQLYAMVWGAMFFPTDWSQKWVHDARIVLLPSEMPDWPVDEIVAFYYPPTGNTYYARSTGFEDVLGYPVEKAAGPRMLEWANWLMTYAYEVDTDAQGFVLYNPDGSPVLLLDIDGKPIESTAYPGASAALERYVDQIDTFRQISAKFEQPLGDGDLPDP